MTGKRDVREEINEAARICDIDADFYGRDLTALQQKADPVLVAKYRLASRVLKHEAGAETIRFVCEECNNTYRTEVEAVNYHGCGGTLAELIERYRGEDA